MMTCFCSFLQHRPFDYLLNLPLSALSHEKAAALRADLATVTQQRDALAATSATSLWLADLATVERRVSHQLAAVADDVAQFAATARERTVPPGQARAASALAQGNTATAGTPVKKSRRRESV